MRNPHLIIFFTIVFFLFYFEKDQIGPFTVSQLWKIPVFSFLLKEIILRKWNKPFFLSVSYLRAGKNLFTTGTFISPLPDVINFIRYMFFPLFFEYFKFKLGSMKELDRVLLTAAQFVILSGIPFVFFGLESRGTLIYDLEEVKAYVGVFQGAHAASATTAIAILVLVKFLNDSDRSSLFKWINSSLVIFGTYLLYFTFVRTGYAMFVVGAVVLFFPRKFNVQQIVGGALAFFLLFYGFYYLLETNEFFYNRVFDIRGGQQTAAGSGRLIFFQGTLDLWLSGNFLELLFGLGLEGFQDGVEKYTGFNVIAHNEFFNELGINGLIGVTFFLIYIYSLFHYIQKRKYFPSYRIALATFFVYVSLMMTQGGAWFQVDFFLALIFLRLYKESEMAFNSISAQKQPENHEDREHITV